jgi:hypothetical protein
MSINQADIVERSRQVCAMQEIFGHATKVVVWLGEETKTSTRAIAFLKEMGADVIARSTRDESGNSGSKTESKMVETRENRPGSVAHPKFYQHSTKDHAYNMDYHHSSAGNEHMLWGIPMLYYDFYDSVL